MKNFRKITIVILAMMLSIMMALPAFSGISYSISVINSTHTYEVYQIFAGYVNQGIIVNVRWGQNGTGTEGEFVSAEILAELEAMNGQTDREKLAIIEKYANLDPENKYGTVTQEEPLSGIDPGYYLIKDIDGVLAGLDDTYTTYIVRMADSIVVSPKSDKTTAEKTVTDINDVTGEKTVGEWADFDVNDAVPFQLSATIDSEYDRYAVYKLNFHDTLSNGLSFNETSVSVKVDGNTLTKGLDYTIVTADLTDDCTFEVCFADLKAIASVKAGSVITVDYTATLTSDAVIGNAGNVNTMFVEYSNNPNDETGSETGKTPEETATVFTYQLSVNKITKNPDYDPEVEGSDEYIPLVGARFTLDKKIFDPNTSTYVWKNIGLTMSEDKTVFTSVTLDEGQYCLTEIMPPLHYNGIAPIYFEVISEGEDGVITSLTAVQTDEDGVVLEGEAITATFTGNAAEGRLVTDIVNVKGTQLPETGGMGTVIFYALGGSMIFAAVILFAAKKYSESKKEH